MTWLSFTESITKYRQTYYTTDAGCRYGDKMIPKHKTVGSAGADLVCAKTIIIQPNETKLVSTGAYVPSGLPSGIALLLMTRSSIALNKRLILANGVGLIDSDYPDEIKCMYTNLNTESVTLERGERIAQLVPVQYVYGVFDVEQNTRHGGLGSTNEKA